jgi:hypothetical protein
MVYKLPLGKNENNPHFHVAVPGVKADLERP